ncbi:MAG: NAD-dependent epimerase/dehydratase family protein [Pseudonocardiaceae bacterium]
MRVLVTGAAGFLGHAVVAALAEHGHEPVALVRGDRRTPGHAVTTRYGDLLDPASMRACSRRRRRVSHLAARTRVRDSLADPLAYWRTNLVGTLNLLEALAGGADGSVPP